MTQSRTREETIQQDVADLHRLGYAQELFRSMGGFSNFAISFSIISILTGAVILFDYGLAWAGTAAVLIGWPLVTVFVLCIAASMAEIASAYPTAGGLYYWASKMRNKDWGWWTAWFNLIGQFAIVAGINFAAAFFLNQTIVSPLTGGGFTNTTEVLKLGDTLLISGQLLTMAILMIGQLVLNIAGINVVAFLNQVSVWWHIAFVVLIAGALFILGTKDTTVDAGLTLFAIQPQDTLGSWDITLPGYATGRSVGLVQHPVRARPRATCRSWRSSSRSSSRTGPTPAMTRRRTSPRRPSAPASPARGACSCPSPCPRSSASSSCWRWSCTCRT